MEGFLLSPPQRPPSCSLTLLVPSNQCPREDIPNRPRGVPVLCCLLEVGMEVSIHLDHHLCKSAALSKHSIGLSPFRTGSLPSERYAICYFNIGAYV